MKSWKMITFLAMVWTGMAAADEWQPFQFQPGQAMIFHISQMDSAGPETVGIFRLTIQSTDTEELLFQWHVTEEATDYSDQFSALPNQVSGKILVSMMGQKSNLAELIVKQLFAPTFEIQYRDLELSAGHELSRRGGRTTIKVSDQQKINDFSGFQVQFFEADRLSVTHLIDPHKPLPLMVMLNQDEQQTTFTLTKFVNSD